MIKEPIIKGYSSLLGLSDSMEVLVFTVIIAIVILFALLLIGPIFSKGERETEDPRAEEVQEFAQESGYRYYATADASLLAHLGHFEVTSRGRPSKALSGSNRYQKITTIKRVVLGKASSLTFTVFDIRYFVRRQRSGGKWVERTVVYLHDRELRLPSFRVRPVNFFTRPLPFTNSRQRDVSSNPDFRKSYLVEGDDEKKIAQLFSKDLVSFFLDQVPKVYLEAKGKKLVFHTEKLIEPSRFESLIQSGHRLLAALKD